MSEYLLDFIKAAFRAKSEALSLVSEYLRMVEAGKVTEAAQAEINKAIDSGDRERIRAVVQALSREQ